jgi:hypothetical protein
VSIHVYIIRRNTPESRLLSQVGFNRDSLPVAEWRGRWRSRGGYGKSPVAWRVSGQENVERLCKGLVRILGDKPASQRTSQERTALDRATRTLAAFRNRERKALSASVSATDCEQIVSSFLAREYASASDTEIAEVVLVLGESPIRSIDDLRRVANEVLRGRPAVWARARADFIHVMTSVAAPTRTTPAACCDALRGALSDEK